MALELDAGELPTGFVQQSAMLLICRYAPLYSGSRGAAAGSIAWSFVGQRARESAARRQVRRRAQEGWSAADPVPGQSGRDRVRAGCRCTGLDGGGRAQRSAES